MAWSDRLSSELQEARREGRKGSNYVELVKNALQELPEK